MGRPKKPKAEKREERLNLRLTRSERMTIEANAAFQGIGTAEFVRLRALDRRMPASKLDLQAMAVRSAALVRIGNNLNQIAHHANAGKPLLMGELSYTLARINEQLDQLYDPPPDSGGSVVQGSGPLLPSR